MAKPPRRLIAAHDRAAARTQCLDPAELEEAEESMGFWAPKNLSPIGVDLGCDSLKLLQVACEDPPQLLAAASADLPPEARRSGDVQRQFIVQTLRDLIRQGGFKGRRAVVSINAAASYVQHLRLAKGDESMLEQLIEMELRGRLPLDPSGMVIRHVPVGEVFADGATKQELICMAASRESVMRSVQMMRQAGLDVVGMHCEPTAILQGFAHLFRRAGDENRTTFFIDIGSATTKALIAHGRQLVFAKTIHVGGDHFTRQLANEEGVEVSEARLRRIRQAGAQAEAMQGASSSAAPAGEMVTESERRRGGAAGTAVLETPPAQSAGPVGDAFGETLETLIDELQLCAGYHRSMFADRPIEKVVFLGGESRQIVMCQRIAQALRLPAQLGDPLARLVRTGSSQRPVGVDLRQSQPGWAVPLGLCILPTNL